METNGLQIGNIVRHKTFNGIEEIVSVGESFVEVKRPSGRTSMLAFSLLPVILTHAHMLRFGFALHSSSDTWKGYQHENGFSISQHVGESEASANNYLKGFFYYGVDEHIELIHAHELQNLFQIVCKKPLIYKT